LLGKKFASPKQLTQEEEDTLEKKITWIFGTVRSGTTWLGTELLKHPENVPWAEPYIGWHLLALRLKHGKRSDYFFSQQYKKDWMPALRKLILSRTFSHAKSVSKNVIIKEPNGVAGADLIMECLPHSKLIFLLRDGRDIVDSLIDAHRPGSWNEGMLPLRTKKDRIDAIKEYSDGWMKSVTVVWKTYQKQPDELRYFVKYEDLRKNTFPELKKIYNFIGVEISDDKLKKIIERYEFDNIPTAKKGPGKFTRAATPGGWKNNFNYNEKYFMNSIMKDNLTKFDYDVLKPRKTL